jgi:ribosomal-protein-alanine N-acetyltransferase
MQTHDELPVSLDLAGLERIPMMEKRPYQPEFESITSAAPASATEIRTPEIGDWRHGVPTLCGALATLRELRATDAPSLLASMSTDEVNESISSPPSTVEGFEKFIGWAHRERAAGRCVCFAVVPHGSDAAVGLFQLRSLEPDFGTSEWGFALGREYWGTGLFGEGAELLLDFAFEVVGAHRLEARAAFKNNRGNGALRKLGAVQECVLPRSFLRNGEYLDQVLWSILAEEWLEAKAMAGPVIVH